MYTHALNPSSIFLTSCGLCISNKGFGFNAFRVFRPVGDSKIRFPYGILRKGYVGNFTCLKFGREGDSAPRWCFHLLNIGKGIVSAVYGRNSGIGTQSPEFTSKKRKVVEHISLWKAKKDLSEIEEKDMLDYLFTFQYHMKGIVALSLGRIADPNVEGFTHAVFMRFQRKEDLAKFYENSDSGVLKDHVMPYCHGTISVDYESEVEDDVLAIFRRGEEFNYGLEFILLISVVESATDGPVEDAFVTLANLTTEFRSLVVQATQGSNFNIDMREYTHGAVIRFASFEALQLFRGSSAYKNMWRLKFQTIVKKALEVYFIVNPVGTDIM